jgi:hypothetical protein
MTSGTGLLYHTFDHYGPHKGGSIGERQNGVLISNATGKALTFALFGLQDRGRLFIGHATEVYEGQVIGIHSRSNDLTVNCLKGKQLTNMRASGTDEAQVLTPPIRMTWSRLSSSSTTTSWSRSPESHPYPQETADRDGSQARRSCLIDSCSSTDQRGLMASFLWARMRAHGAGWRAHPRSGWSNDHPI